MKLFSWFIKTDKCSKSQKECLEKSGIKEVENALEYELDTINKNNMWPIPTPFRLQASRLSGCRENH